MSEYLLLLYPVLLFLYLMLAARWQPRKAEHYDDPPYAGLRRRRRRA